ncbi:hypothetical protein LCGC14_1350090 [marine sediment metagenome]|uniref:Uncharacterized protein n=1 Tax=marine sediment metagenome TaxID=412755 RepID=A0A0F9KX79_9ZZZZ
MPQAHGKRKPGRPKRVVEDPQRAAIATAEAEPEEERDLESGESVVKRTQRRPQMGSLAIECRIVYLGGHPKKSVYYQGSVIEVEDAQGKKLFEPNDDGATTYDFARYDSKGRAINERMTADSKMWAICHHIGHAVRFNREVDGDESPVFEIRARPEVLQKIERYQTLLNERGRSQDGSKAVLQAMNLQ